MSIMARRKNTKSSSEMTEESRRRFVGVAKNIEKVPVDEWLKSNFLPYAWSYNLDRALVDVSGLKPVQRRILYTMYKRGLSPTGSRMKVATLAGAVLQFHPHGDSSVSAALKNMARPHVFRVPLIDGKGDFGAPGKPGAAGRYIEARLTKAAWINVEDISQNAVRMIPNYDDTTVEPKMIPVRWPVGVVNGGSGMAVAYASNIPSHNPGEIMRACIQLVKDPETSDRRLEGIIKGPDFNMGGLVTSVDGVHDYLETGSGTFTLRARYNVEPGPRGTTRIEYYEIPFGTYPEKIIESIQKQMGKDLLKDVSDYKDLSDLKHPIRLVVILRSGAQVKKAIEDLFALTPLQSRFSVNMTTIVNNRPVQSSMKSVLLDFIDFRRACVSNRLRFDMGQKKDRLHLIDGLLKVLLDIDAAIKIIRGADDAGAAKDALKRRFKIDDVQADHVLSLQLRRLTRMDNAALNAEDKTLKADISDIERTLNDVSVLDAKIIEEFKDTLKVIDDERHTEINGMTDEEFRRNQSAATRKIKAAARGAKTSVYMLADGSIMKTSADDAGGHPYSDMVKIPGNADLGVVGSDGSMLPLSLLSLEDDHPADPASLALFPDKSVKAVRALPPTISSIIAVTKNGKIRHVKVNPTGGWPTELVTVDDGDKIVSVMGVSKVAKSTTVIMVSAHGRVLRFPLESMKPCGSGAHTIAGMRLSKGDSVVGVLLAGPTAKTLTSASTVTVKTTPLDAIPTQGRGVGGIRLHQLISTDSISQIGIDVRLASRKGKTMTAPDSTAPGARPAPLKRGTVLAA